MYTVDRFEGETVFLEDRENNSFISVPKFSLPVGVREGDILSAQPDGSFIVEVDAARLAANDADSRLKRLLERSKKQ